MKKILFYTIVMLIVMTGCTRLITAPMSIAGTSVGTAIKAERSTNN